MSKKIATYSFLPWLRQGIANKITGSSGARVEVSVQLELTGDKIDGGQETEPIIKKVQLYGPGDVAGIESKAIIKTEPLDMITNFEPNYMPYIDFYDEDFVWRYTPAAPDTALHRLTPWIALAVLKDGEFDPGKNIKDKPLPFIKIKDPAAALPPADQLWAWAHVHVNRDLAATDDEIVSTDMTGSVLPKFQNFIKEDPDLAYCRLLCPRELEANTAYHAFLIPVFESGRLAGLGLEPGGVPDAVYPAWNYPASPAYSPPETGFYPYYHRWYFRTGTVGDFEYLVRLLEPKPVDKRVGRRDMDVTDPGSNLTGIDTSSDLGGVLKLGGALQVPYDTLKGTDKAEVDKYNNWDQNPSYPHEFQKDLAGLINLSDDYVDENHNAAATDPVITPPLYARWHSLSRRLLKEPDGTAISPDQNWVHQLNLDPRYRVASGFGTKVVQENQEKYMNAAWEQIGDILKANETMRRAQMGKGVSSSLYTRHVQRIQQESDEKVFILAAPVRKRVIANGFTVYHQLQTSRVRDTVLTTPMRRALRPGSRLMKRLPFGGGIEPGNLLERIDEGDVSAAPPKEAPEGVTTVNDAADTLVPANAPSFIVRLLRRFPWLKYILLLIALLIVLLVVLFNPSGLMYGAGSSIAGFFLLLFGLLFKWSRQVDDADSIREENQTPGSEDELPHSSDFKITFPGDSFTASTGGTTDSVEAGRFKSALGDVHVMLAQSAAVSKDTPSGRAGIGEMSVAAVDAVNPEMTFPRHFFKTIYFPPYLVEMLGDDFKEEFKEAMAYPEFDTPMYKPLADISSELLLPNINYIEQNCISLLETNQEFIESYMVGLNHEFARELLWREYPTDQRGSYFRQFWDPGGCLDTGNLTADELKEKLKDIPPLHTWKKSSELGDHDHREEGRDNENELVLVIRGELLKKYPNAVIYAHKARWQEKPDGSIDNKKVRQLEPLTEAQEENPPPEIVQTPLYEAKVHPDIYFFGFDLTAEEARGGTGEDESDRDKAGWFFIIKERPGEPRFGLDMDEKSPPGDLNTWNDLTWGHVSRDAGASSFVRVDNPTPPLNWVEPPDPPDPDAVEAKAKHKQYTEDQAVAWNENTNSADLAYILYQVPVMVAVHAAEMLPEEE